MESLSSHEKAVLWYALAAYVKAICKDYDYYLELLRHVETTPPPKDYIDAWYLLDLATIDADAKHRE